MKLKVGKDLKTLPCRNVPENHSNNNHKQESNEIKGNRNQERKEMDQGRRKHKQINGGFRGNK